MKYSMIIALVGTLTNQVDGNFTLSQFDDLEEFAAGNVLDIPVSSIFEPSVKKPLRDQFRISNPKAVLLVNVASF